ncbi:MHS family MFS transporter [Roseateles sp. DAIF2]|uniref:MFS transporter n=1 Tax=Roseateles sp. DAIF2 TaxID=2714952 RepID=UPI0018A2FFFF|nr:MFS transporter [Roseateles sp. DAIF2]QPF73592.1 MHS family MFS transporter [Roseateles sp. DAIF2]
MNSSSTLNSSLVPEAQQGPADSLAPGDIAVGVVIGRASEYFDFFVYGIASALVFPAVFFPHMGRLEGTLFSFALFSLAFIVRPLGTLAGMEIQRRYGRSVKLTVALFLLGSSTAGMALLPGYASAGAAAIGMLAACRIGQGLAQGGSWDGLPSLLALNAPPHRRGWYAMLGQLGAPLGFLVACGLFAYLWGHLSSNDFLEWGWRFPFFAAFAINVVALFARLRLVVTHEYERELGERELEPCDVGELMREQGGNVVIGAFAALASYALFHLVTVFPLSWVMLHSSQDIGAFLAVQLVGALLAAAAMPLSGILADRIGRRSTLGGLAVAIGLFSLVAPWLLDGGARGQDLFILFGFVLLGLSYGQSAGAVTSNFLPRLRYTGAALTADLAWLIGAAFAPLVALGLSARFGLGAVSLYLLSGAACTLAALRINKSLAQRD